MLTTLMWCALFYHYAVIMMIGQDSKRKHQKFKNGQIKIKIMKAGSFIAEKNHWLIIKKANRNSF